MHFLILLLHNLDPFLTPIFLLSRALIHMPIEQSPSAATRIKPELAAILLCPHINPITTQRFVPLSLRYFLALPL